MKDQWKQGLQWGAVVSVAWWLSPHIAAPFYELAGGAESIGIYYAICAAITALVGALIVMTWSKLSRAVLLVLVGVVLWQADSTTGSEPATFPYALARFIFWHQVDAIQLLPLLLITPERPRLTLALALVGRGRDSLATLSGRRWPLVAAGVFYLDRLARGIGQSIYGESGSLRCRPDDLLVAIAPFVLLFGLAALPQWRPRAMARP